MMKKYTVILMYPDYSTDHYGENWTGVVEASDVPNAVQTAQNRMALDCRQNGGGHFEPDDAFPIDIFEGEQPSLFHIWHEHLNRLRQDQFNAYFKAA